MTHMNTESEISFGVDLADDNSCLVMTISNSSVERRYGISLADARNLSLELVKHAGRAESRGRRKLGRGEELSPV